MSEARGEGRGARVEFCVEGEDGVNWLGVAWREVSVQRAEWCSYEGQAPAAKVERRTPTESGRRGEPPPTHLGAAGRRPLPTFGEGWRGLWSVRGGGGRGDRGVSFASRGATQRGLVWVPLGGICPRSSLRRRPEPTRRFWARVLYVCFFGLRCCFPTLRYYLGVHEIMKRWQRRFETPAGAVGALGADKAAHLHCRAAGGLTAAAAGPLFIAAEPGRLAAATLWPSPGPTPAAAPRRAAWRDCCSGPSQIPKQAEQRGAREDLRGGLPGLYWPGTSPALAT